MAISFGQLLSTGAASFCCLLHCSHYVNGTFWARRCKPRSQYSWQSQISKQCPLLLVIRLAMILLEFVGKPSHKFQLRSCSSRLTLLRRDFPNMTCLITKASEAKPTISRMEAAMPWRYGVQESSRINSEALGTAMKFFGTFTKPWSNRGWALMMMFFFSHFSVSFSNSAVMFVTRSSQISTRNSVPLSLESGLQHCSSWGSKGGCIFWMWYSASQRHSSHFSFISGSRSLLLHLSQRRSKHFSGSRFCKVWFTLRTVPFKHVPTSPSATLCSEAHFRTGYEIAAVMTEHRTTAVRMKLRKAPRKHPVQQAPHTPHRQRHIARFRLCETSAHRRDWPWQERGLSRAQKTFQISASTLRMWGMPHMPQTSKPGNRARQHAKTNLGDIKGPSQYKPFGIAQVTFGTSTGHFWHVDGSLLACRRAITILLFTSFQPAGRPILLWIGFRQFLPFPYYFLRNLKLSLSGWQY